MMILKTAIRAGDLATATGLIRSGADVNRLTPEGLTHLIIALGLGQSQMVTSLLTASVKVQAVEIPERATALHKAALSGAPDLVGLLLDRGTFIDQQARSSDMPR